MEERCISIQSTEINQDDVHLSGDETLHTDEMSPLELIQEFLGKRKCPSNQAENSIQVEPTASPKRSRNRTVHRPFKRAREFQTTVADGLGGLPREILLHIFRFLDSPLDWRTIFLVSSHWNQLACVIYRPSCYHSIGLRNAVRNGNVPLVKRLLQDPLIDPSAMHSESLQLAAKSGNMAIVRLLLDAGVDPSDDFNFAITWASLHGHPQVVKRLLEDPRVDPSSGNNRALTFAIIHGHLDIVQLLLKDPRTAAPNGNHICWAVSNGHSHILRELLKDERINPCIDDNFAMHLAAVRGDNEMLDLLLKDIRVKRELMRTNPIHSS